MELILIAALSSNNIIGKSGKLPWYSKEDFKHFKKTTMGCPMIMGRKTFESIGKPLPGRLSIVVTRSKKIKSDSDSLKVFNSPSKAIKYCRKSGFEKAFVIGGGEIYEQTIKKADKLIISRFPFKVEGDTYFPEIKEINWQVESRKIFDEFTVLTYTRKN